MTSLESDVTPKAAEEAPEQAPVIVEYSEDDLDDENDEVKKVRTDSEKEEEEEEEETANEHETSIDSIDGGYTEESELDPDVSNSEVEPDVSEMEPEVSEPEAGTGPETSHTEPEPLSMELPPETSRSRSRSQLLDCIKSESESVDDSDTYEGTMHSHPVFQPMYVKSDSERFLSDSMSEEDLQVKLESDFDPDEGLEGSEREDQLDPMSKEFARNLQKRYASPLYSCAICSACFQEPGLLSQHMNTHTGLKPYNCPHCENCFHTMRQRSDHLRRHGDLNLPCTICFLRFNNDVLLKKHVATHTGEKPYSCDRCSNNFMTERALQYHVIHAHESGGSFPCGKCNRKFQTEESVKFHEFLRHFRAEFERPEFSKKCPHCEYCQSNWARIEAHIESVHRKVAEPIYCICGVAVNSVLSLRQHINRSDCKGPEFKCETCSKIFIAESALNKHRAEAHNEGPKKLSFCCNECGRRFNRKKELRSHCIRVHKEVVEGSFKCSEPDCHRVFKIKASLVRHEQFHKAEMFRCETCGKEFRARADYRKHLRIHSGEKPYVCRECGDAFKQLGHLTLHQRTHTGERPYKCEMCDKAFTTNSALKKHGYTHQNVKPFKCTECDRAYTDRSRLMYHMKDHDVTEVAYICTHCEAKFVSQHKLDHHMQLSHSTDADKPFVCEQCDKRFRSKKSMYYHRRCHQHENGEAQFPCPFCDKKFLRSCTRKTHVTKQHRDVSKLMCTLCYKQFKSDSLLRSHRTTVHGQARTRTSASIDEVDGRRDDDLGEMDVELEITRAPLKTTLMG